ncbi:unnamed protein product, partial [Ectocarpus fasciculatus]
ANAGVSGDARQGAPAAQGAAGYLEDGGPYLRGGQVQPRLLPGRAPFLHGDHAQGRRGEGRRRERAGGGAVQAAGGRGLPAGYRWEEPGGVRQPRGVGAPAVGERQHLRVHQGVRPGLPRHGRGRKASAQSGGGRGKGEGGRGVLRGRSDEDVHASVRARVGCRPLAPVGRGRP